MSTTQLVLWFTPEIKIAKQNKRKMEKQWRNTRLEVQTYVPHCQKPSMLYNQKL